MRVNNYYSRECVALVNARMSEGGTVTVRTLELVEGLKSWLQSQKSKI